MQAEAGANVVQDEDHAVVVAYFPHAGQKSFDRQLRVVSGVVLERRQNYARDLAAVFHDRAAEALEIVESKINYVRAIFRRHSAGKRRAPCIGAVVCAGAHYDLRPPRRLTRDFSRPGAYVGTVFREHRPVGERRDRDKMLREIDPHRPRRVEAVAEFHLPARSFLDFGMPMAEDAWAVCAYVVDVLIAIDVPNVGTLAAREK